MVRKKKMILLSVLLLLPHTVFATEKDIIQTITKNSEISTQLVDDQTVDHNIRYIGENPNNYLSFNGEVWRIIGVMNNVLDEEGNALSRVKIVRGDSIGNYSWDITNSAFNSGQGVNEWSNSYLSSLLNTSGYWDRSTATCGSGMNGATVTCDFTTTGLTEEAKKYIETVVWNTGSNWDNDYRLAKGNDFYNYLLSGHGGNYCSSGMFCTDTVERTSSWLGKVGLINSADYIMATDGGSTNGRNQCLNDVVIKDWDDNNPECYNNDWLTTSSEMWTMSPYTDNTYNTTLFYTRNKLGMRAAFYTYGLRPSLYLTSNLFIVDGDGSSSNPYQILPYLESSYSMKTGDSMDALELFTSKFDLDDIDSSLISSYDEFSSVQDGVILASKAGNSEIMYLLDDMAYFIRLTITNDTNVVNPETHHNAFLIWSVVLLSVSILFYEFFLKKQKSFE